MNKIKKIIGRDEAAAQRNAYVIELRKDIIKEAISFFEGHNLVIKSARLENGNFINAFNELFSSTFLDKLPESINIAQRVKLLGIDITNLEKLQQQYNAYMALPENTDFNIYATTKRQLEKYEACLHLKRSFEDFLKVNDKWINNSYARYISDASKDALLWKNGKLQINLRGYILNENI